MESATFVSVTFPEAARDFTDPVLAHPEARKTAQAGIKI
jgi:hypothetical protein